MEEGIEDTRRGLYGEAVPQDRKVRATNFCFTISWNPTQWNPWLVPCRSHRNWWLRRKIPSFAISP